MHGAKNIKEYSVNCTVYQNSVVCVNIELFKILK